MRQPGLGRELRADGVQLAATQGADQVALQDDALPAAAGEAVVGEMFGARLDSVARLPPEPAGRERHGLALDQAMIEPGGAGRRDLPAEIEIRAVGEDERRPLVVRPAEAPDLDDPA